MFQWDAESKNNLGQTYHLEQEFSWSLFTSAVRHQPLPPRTKMLNIKRRAQQPTGKCTMEASLSYHGQVQFGEFISSPPWADSIGTIVLTANVVLCVLHPANGCQSGKGMEWEFIGTHSWFNTSQHFHWFNSTQIKSREVMWADWKCSGG